MVTEKTDTTEEAPQTIEATPVAEEAVPYTQQPEWEQKQAPEVKLNAAHYVGRDFSFAPQYEKAYHSLRQQGATHEAAIGQAHRITSGIRSPAEGRRGVPEPTIEPTEIPTDRETELKEAIEFSEKVESGEETLPPGTDVAEYQRSIQDIKGKLNLLQQAQQARQSYQRADRPIPTDIQEQIDQLEALALSPAAPFVRTTDDKVEITAPLTTIEKAGVSLSEFEQLGFPIEVLEEIKLTEEGVQRAKEIINELNTYPNLSTAISEGKIELIREASELGMIPKLSVVDAQIMAADTELKRQSLERLADFIDPSTGTLALGDAIESGVDASLLRNAGYDISEGIYTQVKTGIAREKVTQVLGETAESLVNYIDTHIKDEGLLDLLEQSGLDADSLASAKAYIDATKETLVDLEGRNKATQLYIIADALGFTKRQKMAKLANPLSGLSVEERNLVLEKYLELNQPMAEIRRQSFDILKDQWIQASPIVGISILSAGGAVTAGIVSTIFRGATAASLFGLSGYGYYETTKHLPELSVGEAILSYGVNTLMLAGGVLAVKPARIMPVEAVSKAKATTLAEIPELRRAIDIEIAKMDTASRFTKSAHDIRTISRNTLEAIKELPDVTKDAIRIAMNDVDYAVMRLSDAIKASPQWASKAVQDALTDLRIATTKAKQSIIELPTAIKAQLARVIEKAEILASETTLYAKETGRIIANDVEFAVNRVNTAIKASPKVISQAVKDAIRELELAGNRAKQYAEDIGYNSREYVERAFDRSIDRLQIATSEIKALTKISGKIVANDVTYAIDRVMLAVKQSPEIAMKAIQEALTEIKAVKNSVALTGKMSVKIAIQELEYYLQRLTDIIRRTPDMTAKVVQDSIHQVDLAMSKARAEIKTAIETTRKAPSLVGEKAVKALESLETKFSDIKATATESLRIAMNDVDYYTTRLMEVIRSTSDKTSKAMKDAIHDLDMAIYRARTEIASLPENVRTKTSAMLDVLSDAVIEMKAVVNSRNVIASDAIKVAANDMVFGIGEIGRLAKESPQIAKDLITRAISTTQGKALNFKVAYEQLKNDIQYEMARAGIEKPLRENLEAIRNKFNRGDISLEEAMRQVESLKSTGTWKNAVAERDKLIKLQAAQALAKKAQQVELIGDVNLLEIGIENNIRRAFVTEPVWDSLHDLNIFLSRGDVGAFNRSLARLRAQAAKLPAELKEGTLRQLDDLKKAGEEYIESQKPKPMSPDDLIQQTKEGMKHDENTLDNAARLRRSSKNPTRQKTLDDHIRELKRSIEEKKKVIQIAEKTKVEIPLRKVIMPDEVGKQLPEIAKEKAITPKPPPISEPITEPRRRVVGIPGWFRKPEEAKTPAETEAQREWEREFERAMPARRRQMLEDLDIDLTEAVSPYIRTGTIPTHLISPAPDIELKRITKPVARVVLEPEPITEPEPIVEPVPEPEPEPVPEPEPEPVPEPVPEPEPEPEPTPKPKPIIIKKEEEERETPKPPIKPGTMVWIQGRPFGGAMYQVLPPPYKDDDMYSTRDMPQGYVDKGFRGKGSAAKSIQIVGGKPYMDADVDIGIAFAHIRKGVEKPDLSFTQDKEDAYKGEDSSSRNMRKNNWWDDSFYEEPAKKRKQPVEKEYTYRGHRILPPDLGVEL